MRVVIDSNVFVSALIGHEGGAPHRVIQAFTEDEIDVVVSPHLLDELEDVLARPFVAKRTMRQERAEYVARIRAHAQLFADPEPIVGVVRDPKDDYLVALARAAGADAIVTGDGDLLDAALDRPPAITARQLLNLLDQPSE